MSDTEARVKKIIAEQLGVPEADVTNEKAFVADLVLPDTVQQLLPRQDPAGMLGQLYPAARRCHRQLGDTADLYSTTDVADDLESEALDFKPWADPREAMRVAAEYAM